MATSCFVLQLTYWGVFEANTEMMTMSSLQIDRETLAEGEFWQGSITPIVAVVHV